MPNHQYYMTKAIELAQNANPEEVPVAALVVENDEIISQAVNQREEKSSILAHAEILALESAAKIKNSWNLSNCTLYVTLEPCAMCAGAIMQAHIEEVIFGAYDLKAGGLESKYHIATKNLKITAGILELECQKLLSDFFKDKRN